MKTVEMSKKYWQVFSHGEGTARLVEAKDEEEAVKRASKGTPGVSFYRAELDPGLIVVRREVKK